MSRYPIRARILRRDGLWLVILPTGRRVNYWSWPAALRDSNRAVYHERRFEAAKNAPRDAHWREH